MEWLKKLDGEDQVDFLAKVHEEQRKLGNTKAGEGLAFSKKGGSKTLASLGQDDDEEDFFGDFAVGNDSDEEMPEVMKGSVVHNAPSQFDDASADPAEMHSRETAVLQLDGHQIDNCPDKQPPPDTTPPVNEMPCEPIQCNGQDPHQGIPKDLHMSEGLVTPMDIDALGGLSVNEQKGLPAPSPITRPAAHEEPQAGSQGVVHGSASTGQDDLHQPPPAEHEQDPAPMETEPTDVSESHAQAEPASDPPVGEATVKADAAEPASHQNTTSEAVTEPDPGSQRPPPTPIFACSPKPKGMPTLAQAVKGDAAEPASQQNTSREAVTEADPGSPTPMFPCSPKPKGMPALAQAVKGDAAQPASQQNTSREAVTEADPGSQCPPPTPIFACSPKPKGMPTLAQAVKGDAAEPASQQNTSREAVTEADPSAHPVLPRPLSPHVAPVKTAVVLPKEARPTGLLPSRPTFLTAQPRSRLQHVGTAMPASVQPLKGDTSPRRRIAAPPTIPHKQPYAVGPISGSAGQLGQPQRRPSGGSSIHRIFPAQTPLPSRRDLPMRCPEVRHASPTTVLQQGSVAAIPTTTVLQQGSVAAIPTPVANKQPSTVGHVSTPRAPPANTFSCQARVPDSPTIPVQPSEPPATVETAVPGPLILRRDTSHLKPVSAQLSEETRKLNQMLLQAEQMHDEAMALRVRVAIHGCRLARLDNPILLDAFKSLKQRADEIMAREE